MLDKIFDLMFSSGGVQFFGVFLWGIASVILSPCGISMIPLVVAYVENTENPSKIRAFKISCAFCLGIILNLILVALIISGIGILFGGFQTFLTLITAFIFIITGLQLTGLIHLRFLSFGSRIKGTESQNMKGAVILGTVSGLAVGSCSIAYVSPVLSLAMSKASTNFIYSIGLVMSYSVGYSFVLICSGTFAQIFSGYLQSEKGNSIMKIVNLICGIALICGGIYLIYGERFALALIFSL